MRQFILAKDYGTADYNIAFYSCEDGKTQLTSADEIKQAGEVQLVLKRPNDKGGNVIIPFMAKNFSYAFMDYTADGNTSKAFTCKVKIPDPNKIGDYSIIIAKKGLKFNERNKWTAMSFNKDIEGKGSDLAKDLADRINYNTVGHGIKAEVSDNVITLTATEKGQDYVIKGADFLFGQIDSDDNVGIDGDVTHGMLAYGTAEYVKDLAEKAAADAGFEYTYRDAYYYLYPEYPLNPLAQPDAEDTGFDIYTLKFAEPRRVKTTDEAVNQVVQIAFPSGKGSALETILKALL